MKLVEIAKRIDKHLKKAEKEPDKKLHRARAYASGRWVYVIYVSYWHAPCHLSKADALKYLEWLDQNSSFSRHFHVLRGER